VLNLNKINLKKKTVNIITLGCSKNLVDSEVLMRQLGNDYSITHNSNEDADIQIVNTCGFIGDAKEESIDTILQLTDAKSRGLTSKVYVTGCLSQRYKDSLIKEIPDVDGFFGVNDLADILKTFDVDYKLDLIGERNLTTPKHYAYLKISEGCDRNCSFCAIPLIRGKHVSKPIEDLLKETNFLASQGVKEIILIAQDLTYYGLDIYKKRRIAELINSLSKVDGIGWIRLHYAYPQGFPLDLIDEIKTNPKVCNYLDIPFQHINNRILKSMKRAHDKETTIKLVDEFRSALPDASLRTTLIVGYPGETEKEFDELYDFVESYKFDRLGVFQYSAEEDTSAYLLEDDVEAQIKQDRADKLMMLQQQLSLEKNKSKEGSVLKVLFDRHENGFSIGRTEFDSPEVDNEVLVEDENHEIKVGEFYDVKILKGDFFDLHGELIK
jgi:ribosomal protein S12 methylthiotransferase